MRKSSNYYKFMEYMAFGIGGWHDDAIMVDNGVIECVAHAKVEFIENYSKLYECNYDKMAMNSDTWLTFKYVLVNEEVINVYYVTNESNLYIGQFILDDYRTQKQVSNAIHKKIVCFFLNRREFCEFHATEEIKDSTATTPHDEIDTFQPYIYIDTDNIDYLMKTHSLLPTHAPTCKNGMEMTDIVVGFHAASIIADGRLDISKIKKWCPADREGNRCGGKEWCMATWKRYEAIIKPEWHNVSLATIANLDFNMLDTKRQKYMTIYKLTKNTIKSMYKCKSITQYRSLTNRLITYVHSAFRNDRCTIALVQYVRAKISMCNVECGVWTSAWEAATGSHESRRYNKSREW